MIAPLRKRKFFSIHEANQAIKEQVEKLNTKEMKAVGRSRRQEYEEIDLPNLRPLPERRYEYAERKMAKVHIDYHVEYEKHLYSVPYTLIHQKVDIRATERMVEIFHQGKSIATHPRSFQAGRYSTLREHMPSNHQFMKDINSERLTQWAASIGPKTTEMVQSTLASRQYPEQAYRTCLGILSLTKKYSYPLLEQACQSACEANVFSYKAVKQELALLQKQTSTKIVETLPSHENIRGAAYYQEGLLP